MKIFIVLGSGNSGAGAIHDYLLSRDDFFSPFKGKEFRLVNDPDGLDELFNTLYNDFSINGSANKLNNFNIFTKNYFYSNYNNKNKILNKQFLNLTKYFISQIIKIQYNGSPQFFFDKINLLKKINFYFKRFLLKKNSKNIELLKMIIPVSKENFIEESRKYLYEIFRLSDKFEEKKNIVIEQGGNFFNPIESTKYYGSDREVIVVTRDPKAIYWSMKRRQSLAYPGHNIKLFVKWYKSVMEKVNFSENNNVIHVKYENFFLDFENQKKILCSRLNIDPKINDNFDLNFTKNNLFKFKEKLTDDEKRFLDNELKDYV
tara:strand:+ start:294 stop:1244 length:951 start_codon:yes stop_codon:yes gene_type:complete